MSTFVTEFREKLASREDIRVKKLIGLDNRFLEALNAYSHVKISGDGAEGLLFVGIVTTATEEMYFEKFFAREITVSRDNGVLFKYIEITTVEDGRVECTVVVDNLTGDWDGCTKLCKLLQVEIDRRNRVGE